MSYPAPPPPPPPPPGGVVPTNPQTPLNSPAAFGSLNGVSAGSPVSTPSPASATPPPMGWTPSANASPVAPPLQQGGFPPQQQQQQQSVGGMPPPMQGGGAPPPQKSPQQDQQGGGFPPQQQVPSQQQGYPPQPQQAQSYPPQQQQQGGGFPPQQQVPPQQAQSYPPQQGGGFPPQQQQASPSLMQAATPGPAQQLHAPSGRSVSGGTPTGDQQQLNNNRSFGQGGTSPGTPATPGQGGGGQRRARPRPTGSNRIDSSQVPSPCRDLHIDHSNKPRFVTSKGVPPLTVTNFNVTDDGNASPKFLRPTLHASPYEASFLNDSHLTWGAVLAPLTDVPEDERPPVVAANKQTGPVRCNRCRAYLNPHVKWLELGRQWQCNFCEVINDCPWSVSNLDGNGRRRDHLEHAELCRGSVDLDVEGLLDYSLKNEAGADIPAQAMHHLFALDVSHAARPSLPDVVDTMRSTLRQMGARYPDAKVSFITYASSLHFYNFQHPSCPQMVVADTENPFVPLPFTLMCWMSVEEDADKIECFLDRLEQISTVADETECAVGAAVKVASLILSTTGGKVILTATTMPTTGLGAIKQPREVHKLYGSDKEKELLRPIEGFWPQTAIECAKKQISFDVLMFPTNYCELITIGQLCHLTNGLQSCYFNYSSQSDALRLKVSLERSLLQLAGFGAILRMRCSPGVKIKGYSGHFLSQDPQDMDLAAVHSGSNFFVEFQHEGKIDHKGYTFFQAAMLYTTREGKRRVRVHTLRLPVCNTYSSLFRNGDLEANLTAVIHRVLRDAVNKGPKFAREEVNKRLIDMLVAYRKYCSSGTHSGQLLLPEQLKLLPLYTLCLCKGNAVVVGTDLRIDERAQSIHDLLTMPMSRVLYYVYPKFYSLRNMLNSNSIGMMHTQTQSLILPPLAQLTTDVVMTHGLYALHDQQANTVYLWIGSQISPNVTQALFGTDDISAVATQPIELWNERLQAVMYAMMRTESGVDRLQVILEKGKQTMGSSVEDAFFRNMLEDEAIPTAQSYSDLLCDFHKKINARLM